MGTLINAIGHYLPSGRITNEELSLRFAVSSDWIIERTGIEERSYAVGESTADMAIKAAKLCLFKSGLKNDEIDCVIVATMTADCPCPSTAAIVQKGLGLNNCCCFDIMAACSGFLYAIQMGNSLIKSGTYKNVLVCAADKMSSIINPNDRKTSLVFADGAGAALLQHSESRNNIIDIICRLDSTNCYDIHTKVGGSNEPLRANNIKDENHYLSFNSKNIFEHGIELMKRAIDEILDRNNLNFDEIDLIVPHQANKRMIEALAVRMKIPIDKLVINVEHIGNTSAASVPIALAEVLEKGLLKGPKKILLASVGAGFTYGASLLNLKF